MFRPRPLTLAVIVVVAACALTVAVPAFSAPKPARITIYVFTATDASGFTDQSATDRAQAVTDAIKVFGRSDVVVPVAQREDAVVTLEITRRVRELAQTSMMRSIWKNNSTTRSPDRMQPFLYGALSVGTFTTELRSDEPESDGEGRHLAKVAEAWVLANRARLAALVEAEPAR